MSLLTKSRGQRGIRWRGVASRDGRRVNEAPWSLVNAPRRDSYICLLLILSAPFMNTVPLMGKLESFGDAASSLLSAPVSIEATSLGSTTLRRDRLGDDEARRVESPLLSSSRAALTLGEASRLA